MPPPMTPGQRRLYRTDYNYMSQLWQTDNEVVLIMTGGSLPIGHQMHIRDLYGEHEEVLTEVVIPPGPPAWIRDRLEKARRGP